MSIFLYKSVSFPGSEGIRTINKYINNQKLRGEDTVLFLLSGGGSALFEKPLCHEADLADITGQLLSCGADIVEINTIRKPK